MSTGQINKWTEGFDRV